MLLLSITEVILLTSCATEKNNQINNSYGAGSQNKLLIISNLATDFTLMLGTATNISLHNNQLNPIVLNTASRILSRHYFIAGSRWQGNLQEEAESSGSQWKRIIVGGFFQGMIGHTRSLDSILLQQLQRINSKYQADVILLIYGKSGIVSAVIKSNTGPIILSMEMYLIDAHTNKILAYETGTISENPYSAENNAALYDLLQTQPTSPLPQKSALIRWINLQAPLLTTEIAKRIMGES